MRVTTVRYQNQSRIAIRQEPGHHWAISPYPADLGSALREGYAAELPVLAEQWPSLPEQGVEMLAPLPEPRRNIMCLGLNYADHAEESLRAAGKGLETPEAPIIFTKATSTVTAPYADIQLDKRVTQQLDWEVELALIIGKGGRHIAAENAFEHVFGYTIINDLSARDLQFRHKQFFLGKSVDGSCPMGPWITTTDEIPQPENLDLSSYVNEAVKQQGNTRAMIFTIPEIIATLARVMTLEAGDIIATGTPSGVGFAREPAEYLKAGDIIRCSIEGLGEITNRIIAA